MIHSERQQAKSTSFWRCWTQFDHQFLELVTSNVDVKDEVVDPLYGRFKHAHNDIIDIFGDFIAIHFKAAKNPTIDSTDAVDEE